MLTAVKCEFKEDSNINKHTHTCDEGVNAHGWMTGDGVTGCSDSGNGNHNKVLTCAAVGGWGRRRPMRLPTHIHTHMHANTCVWVSSSFSRANWVLKRFSWHVSAPTPLFATGSGNSAWECIRIRIRCVCCGVGKPWWHPSPSISVLETPSQLENSTFHILAISKFRICVYNSCPFTGRTKNYYLLSALAASSSACLCVGSAIRKGAGKIGKIQRGGAAHICIRFGRK